MNTFIDLIVLDTNEISMGLEGVDYSFSNPIKRKKITMQTLESYYFLYQIQKYLVYMHSANVHIFG